MLGFEVATRAQPSGEWVHTDPSPRAGQKDPFAPTAHTGLVLQALHQNAGVFNKGSGLDIGVGSGVLLAALGTLGVHRLTGSDIDPEAVRCTQSLMASLGLARRARLINGSMWDELDGDVFDVITANLPAFPASETCDPDHAPHWSCGGPDGRGLMDLFLAGLPRHLAANGVAFIAHNVLLGRAKTDAILRSGGLSSRTVIRTRASRSDARKAAMMNPAIRHDQHVAGLCKYGSYEFMDVEVLDIRHSQPLNAETSH